MENTANKLDKHFIYRILMYALGLLLLAFSVAFAINSNLGISPVNSLPYALSLVTGAKLSTCVICMFSLYLLLQFLLLKKKLKWYNIFQLAFSTMFGYFADFAKWALGDFCIPTYAGRLVMLAISISLIATGISFYVDTKLIPLPTEGLTMALSETLHIKFHNMKIIQDCVTVAIAVSLSLIFLHKLEGVREGTVISALLVGKMIALMQKWVRPLVNKICFPNESAETAVPAEAAAPAEAASADAAPGEDA